MRYVVRLFLCVVFFGLVPGVAAAQVKETWASATLDNDLFVGKDGGYTNGLYITLYNIYENPFARVADLPWYVRLQNTLNPLRAGEDYVEVYGIGQTMVTPSDITRVPPDPEDSPYAGLLFWQSSVVTSHRSGADMSTLMLGVIGPSSGAEQAQKVVHSITGSEEPKGWDYQLKDEPVFMLSRSRFWRYPFNQSDGWQADLVTGVAGSFGSLEVAGNAAAFLRWGVRLQDSHTTFALALHRESNPIAYPGSFFFYIGAGAGYSLYDFYADGSLFRDTPTHDVEPYEGFVSAGGAWSAKSWGVSFSIQAAGTGNEEDSDSRMEFASLTFLWKY